MTLEKPRHKSQRPDWDDYFLGLAYYVARRSTCLRRQVGAVLVKDHRILTTGYNGTPKDIPHCDQVGCLREKLKVPSGERFELCRGIHAEMNAVSQAAIHGIITTDAHLYCTLFPCLQCAKVLVNLSIKRIIVGEDYPHQEAKELLDQAKIEYRVLGSRKELVK